MSYNKDMQKAVILLSGGLDSTTTLAIAIKDGFDCHAVSFDYGQRHKWELKAAQNIARAFKIKKHFIMTIDLRAIGGSALTADNLNVPKSNNPHTEITNEIPVTYVPARNTVFLSLALAYAETINASDIFIGVNAVDYSGYPDCRPEYIAAFEKLANLATKACVTGLYKTRIQAPIINLNKPQIISLGHKLGVDYALTHSCYDPDPATGNACGKCDSCSLRRSGFEKAGLPDPTKYLPDV